MVRLVPGRQVCAVLAAVGLGSSCGGSGAGPSPSPSPTPRPAPAARGGHALAFDEARAQVVLFGGSGATLFGDLWAWNGTTWAQLSASGPTPRDSPIVAYDSSRQRLVLHGGRTSLAGAANALADTWEWDGQAWAQRAALGPPLRVHAVGAFDRAGGKVVLYGGVDAAGRSLSDTWEWDGRNWTQRSNGGPAGCIPSGMAFDPARRKILMLCLDGLHPRADGTYASQLWEWNGAWVPVGDTGPELRPIQPIVSLGASELLLLDGGASQTSVTWHWQGSRWTPLDAPGPPPRTAYGMAFDSARRRVVLFGGGTAAVDFADTWEWDGMRWAEVNVP